MKRSTEIPQSFTCALATFFVLVNGTLFSQESKLTFEQHVRPILKAHCFHCHGEDGVKEGNLDLRLRRFIFKGGESGPGIKPNDSMNSLLLEKVESGEMPPEKKPLSTQQIETIRSWIKQGAVTAREEPASIDETHFTVEEKSFWSFKPIDRPTIPKVKAGHLARTPVDSFILAKLEPMGLTFSEVTSKTNLIRRLYYDLTGLPPTPDEVEQFLNDSSGNATGKLIDQLLANPRYGERWGRHWLDVAGYADSEGYTDKDPVREFAFFFRDYVINSFNQGKQFDQFIIEQLAGDELRTSPLNNLTEIDRERLKATGFLRMAPDGTASGGVDRAIAANETIADTLQIVSTSLLGLTVGCARCHNHRYDPISQDDYYRMRAIFEPALNWKAWKTPQQRQISLYTESEKAIRNEFEQSAKAVEEDRRLKQAAHIERTLYEELLVAPDEKREALRIAYKTEKAKRNKEQIALLEEYPNIQNISAGSLYLYAEQRGRRANEIKAEGQKRAEQLLEKIRSQHLNQVPANEAEIVKKILELPVKERTAEHQKIVTRYPGVFVTIEQIQKFEPEGAAKVKEYFDAAETCRKTDAKTELAQLATRAAEIRAQAPKEYFVRALIESENQTPKTFLFKRGNHSQPAHDVAPGELEIISEVNRTDIPVNDPGRSTTGRRLAYAQHLTNGKHPLVARVIVNRVWLHHFGKGLVESSGDFGLLGSKPTHPKLLDWLANEFMESGWNLKHLQRLILSSTVYQQSSVRTEKLNEVDPDNRLYARQSLRRLESEAIRDSVLQAAGTLVNKMHGPAIPVKEDAVGQIVLGKQKLDGERKPQPGNKLGGEAERRSLYVQVRRTRPLGVLESFDIATYSPNCTQRHFSNVAPQSLMLINSDFMVQYSRKMANRLFAESKNQKQQIISAFTICFSRKPDEDLIEKIQSFLEQQTTTFQSNDKKLTLDQAQQLALANLCHAFLSSNEFIYID